MQNPTLRRIHLMLRGLAWQVTLPATLLAAQGCLFATGHAGETPDVGMSRRFTTAMMNQDSEKMVRIAEADCAHSPLDPHLLRACLMERKSAYVNRARKHGMAGEFDEAASDEQHVLDACDGLAANNDAYYEWLRKWRGQLNSMDAEAQSSAGIIAKEQAYFKVDLEAYRNHKMPDFTSIRDLR